MYMPICNLCQGEIDYSDYFISPRTGKKIPLEYGTEQAHNCPAKPPLKCKNCGERITFNDSNRSANGIPIPVDFVLGTPHNCPKYKHYQLCRNECGSYIYFNKQNHEKTGLWIPYDKATVNVPMIL
jgi:hypothetical protein